MTTSGSYNFSVTALQIITSAAEDIGVLANGQTLDPNDLATFLRTLNLLVKQWQGTSDKFPGLKVWTRQRLTVYFAKGQNLYSVGPAGSDDRASVDIKTSGGAGPQVTSLSSTKAASSTAAVVASTTGMTTGDQIGFVLADGTLGWTTIATVTDGTNLVLAANTLGAANSGAQVFTYTSKAQRFVAWESAQLRDWSNPAQPIDIPVAIYTDVTQYDALTQKNAPGDPTAILVEPGRLSTVIRTNFSTANVYKSLRMTVIYPSEDYDDAAGADDIAYPQEYFAALEWELAFRSAPKFGKEWTKSMQAAYQTCVTEGINFNPQNSSLYFEPARDIYDAGSPFTRP